ncbi:NRDE family protein [Marinobacterium sp. LSUCC0821]|jgi:uncharacterized protein with NRDE domain|uniref:NRDE family protein n=1 Tax=Marinobacterium sp. LSUCC0821 TaxID=2668067 RepID=UPI001452734E|nr:NRDE family protein [Marinobacterium sp. LSUCC0821]QJD71410.1 NRDE family protein [Marinobacterium sp. LSUCC0821]
MCLVALDWQPSEDFTLRLVANRDEFLDRPTAPMSWWPESTSEYGLLAGKDLRAGGTWLALDRRGRIALLTNIRNGYVGKSASRSRGELAVRFVESTMSAEAFIGSLQDTIADFGGFNMLIGDGKELVWFSNEHPTPHLLKSGIHILSNQALNTPWPKVIKARQQMSESLARFESDFGELEILTDRAVAPDEQLPETGVPIEWERLLSAQTILSSTYATRSRCWLVANRSGIDVIEQQLDSLGEVAEDRRFTWSL